MAEYNCDREEEGEVMAKYRKKPVVVEADLYDPVMDDIEPSERSCGQCGEPDRYHKTIKTLEGDMMVCPGDYVITGVRGEMYPCKPDIFEETYEPV